jgi:hypothetical protein
LNSDGFSIPAHLLLFLRSLLLGLLALVFAAASASSDDPAGPAQALSHGESGVIIEDVEVGFQGFYKVGEWAPAWITVRSRDDRKVQLVVDAPDPDDNVVSFPGPFLELKSAASARLETCFRTGRISGELQLAVHDSDGQLLAARRMRSASRTGLLAAHESSELPPALKLDSRVWVTLGKFDLAASFAESEASGKSFVDADADSAGGPHLARFDSLRQLPVHSRALQSVDLLILPTGRQAGGGESLLDHMTADQDALVESWVRRGGHLLISAGAEAAAFEKSPLAKWIPIGVEGQLSVRQLAGFESFAGRNAPLKISGTVPAARLATLPRANIVLRDSSNPHPLIASAAWGLGRVTFVAVDIDAPPLAKWPALKLVLQRLASGGSGAAKVVARKTNRQLTHVGVTDLATQFQNSNEDFADVRRPSYWWVMGLILLFVAVIGPLDYLIVHRLLGRPELTWLTFPILVAASIGAAAWYAQRVNGRGLEINQFNLADIDSATGSVRNNCWISFYSPQHERFAVAVEPRSDTQFGKPNGNGAAVHLDWVSAPENSLGGMYRAGGANFGSRSYRFGVGASTVDNLPVAQWSTKTLSAQWYAELMQPVIESRLESFGTGQLRGRITQHLGAPLEDCLIVASGWAYIPANSGAVLKPDVEWVLKGGGDKGVLQRDLRAFLTGEKQSRLEKKEGSPVGGEITTTTESYNPLGRNLGQQIRMITFHEAAGGSEYTGLANAALRGLELTPLMQVGQGVLIGRVASSPARVLVNGAAVEPASQSTWVRLVLPIAQSGALPDKFIPKPSEPGR